MSDFKNTQSSNQSVPSHIAYHVKDRENAEAFWNRIGCAWVHRDGKGFNIKLDCIPFDGRISLRADSEKTS